MSHPIPEDDAATDLPPQGVRTFLTFLIFLHLFSLMVAVLSQTGTVSGFQDALFTRTGIGYYLNLLGMDFGYDFHLTHNMRGDFDHVCDVVLDTPKGFRGDDEEIDSQNLKTIQLIPDNAWLGVRRQRYLKLGLPIYITAEDDIASDIVRSYVTGALAQNGVEGGKHQFRCRTIAPRGWGSNQKGIDPHDPRFYVNDYLADVVSTGPGEWSLVKLVSEGEATQLENNGQSSTPAPTSNGQSGDSQGGQQ